MAEYNTESGRVLILMATYNSGSFLEEQLRSIEDQSWPLIDVLVSDDGSSDGTIDRLRAWQDRWCKGRFEIFMGPRAGFAENFRSLLLSAGDDADYFAFCDQDDVWLGDKIESGVRALSVNNAPSLFCTPTTLIDCVGQEFGVSPSYRRQPSFKNALVQNIASGNTMTFNRQALLTLQQAARRTSFPFHDWFAYQILTGVGGHVGYGGAPKVRYRQHADNVLGIRRGLSAWVWRLRRLSLGQTREWTNANVASLTTCLDLLTPEARRSFARFTASRTGRVLGRLRRLRQSGVYRQSLLDQLLLYLASITGRI